MEIGRLNALITADDRDFTRKMEGAERKGKSTANSLKSTFANTRLSLPEIKLPKMPSLGGLGSVLGGNLLSGGISAILGGTTNALKEGWTAGIDYQKMLEGATVRLSRFFDTASQTDAFVNQIKKFATASPIFNLDSAVTGAQRLLQMGYAANQVEPMLKSLGDAVGAAGGGPDEINRITAQFAQAINKQKLLAEDLQVVAEANVPVWDALARAIGKSVAETQKLAAAGQIDAKMGVQGIIANLGEMYAGQSEKAANTLAGRESVFADTLNQQLAAATQGNFEQLKKAYAAATEGLATEGASKFAGELNKLLSGMGGVAVSAIENLATGKTFTQAAKTVALPMQAARQAQSGIEAGRELYNDVSSGQTTIEEVLRALPKTAADTWEELKKGAASVLDALGLTGSDAGKSFADGVQKAAAGAKAAGTAVGSGAEQGVRDALQQHSPSKVMFALGSDAAQSFIDGFDAVLMSGKKKRSTAELAAALGLSPDRLAAMRKVFGTATESLLKKGIAFGPGFYTSGDKQIDRLIGENSQRTGIPGERLFAHVLRESGFDLHARGAAGERGPSQFMAATGARYGLKTDADFFNWEKSIRAMADYLRDIGEKFKNENFATAAYNTGEGNKALLKGRIPNPEYVENVMGIVNVIRQADIQQLPATVKEFSTTFSKASQVVEDWIGKAQVYTKENPSAKIQGDLARLFSATKSGRPLQAELNRQFTDARAGKPLQADLESLFSGSRTPAPPVPTFTPKPFDFAKAAVGRDGLPAQQMQNLANASRALTTALTASQTAAGATTQATQAATQEAGKYADAIKGTGDALQKTWQQLEAQFNQSALGNLNPEARFGRFKDFQARLGEDFDNVISSLIEGGGRWKDALANLAKDFFNSIAQEFMLAATGGKHGSLGSLLGGLAGNFFKSLFLPAGGGAAVGGAGGAFGFGGSFAEGGAISGPGTSTSDSIPLWGSDGEFMVNARAVRHYGRDFLERVNDRRLHLPAFATGGYVGRETARPVLYRAEGGIISRERSHVSTHTTGREPAPIAAAPVTVIQNFQIAAPAGTVPQRTQQQIATRAAEGAQLALRRNG